MRNFIFFLGSAFADIGITLMTWGDPKSEPTLRPDVLDDMEPELRPIDSGAKVYGGRSQFGLRAKSAVWG